MKIFAIIFSYAATALGASPVVAQDQQIAIYGGLNENAGSTFVLNNTNGRSYNFDANYESRSDISSPYAGARYTYWPTDRWGVGAEITNSNAYAPDDVLASEGFDRLGFGGIASLITLNATRRFMPVALGNEQLTPYIGAGLGVSMPEIDIITPNSLDIQNRQYGGLAGTVYGGVSYNLTQNLSVFGEYKFNYTRIDTQVEDDIEIETSILSNAINLGLSLDF